jgi:hypothetical protein
MGNYIRSFCKYMFPEKEIEIDESMLFSPRTYHRYYICNMDENNDDNNIR